MNLNLDPRRLSAHLIPSTKQPLIEIDRLCEGCMNGANRKLNDVMKFNVDGTSRGKPGAARIGIVLRVIRGKLHWSLQKRWRLGTQMR